MASHGDISSSISQRAESINSFEFPMKPIFEKITAPAMYHEEHNKKGIISLAVAHNDGVKDIITAKLNQPDLQTWDSTMLPYTLPRAGQDRLLKAVAGFLSREHNAPEPIDPEKMVVMNGVTSILSTMAFILCNPGDTILTPSPMYGAIPRDIHQSGVNIFPVFLSSKAEPDGRKPYELTESLLESALKEASRQGHKVKALLLVNPFNPLGAVYTKQQVMQYLTFCKRHDLHCVVDEIYNCSIFDDSVKSSSIFTFHPDDLPDKNKTHVLWGMAKDFGMPGSPFGIAYSFNQEVLTTLHNKVDFYQVPAYLQVVVAKLLEDKDWLNSYLPTHNRMLNESVNIVIETLDHLGVPYMKPSAGLFIWADFRKFIPNASKESEMLFALHCVDNGIAIVPGSACYYNEFGWFRLIHSLPKSTLIEAMKRLKTSCESFRG